MPDPNQSELAGPRMPRETTSDQLGARFREPDLDCAVFVSTKFSLKRRTNVWRRLKCPVGSVLQTFPLLLR